jgi:hypothetical protein
LWASTSTKNPAYPDTRYVDELIGPDTVTTLPEPTIAAFEDHGSLTRTLDTDVTEADEVMRRLATVGIDMDHVGLSLEQEGAAGFHKSFQEMLTGLAAKSSRLSRHRHGPHALPPPESRLPRSRGHFRHGSAESSLAGELSMKGVDEEERCILRSLRTPRPAWARGPVCRPRWRSTGWSAGSARRSRSPAST